jgi:1-acyl-sn-glycerol-3-phosphate acyltransferase
MSTPYTVPVRIHLARSILRPAFRLVFHALARVRITGRENVPRHGPYLVVINHVSLYDPPFAVAFWPAAPEVAGAAEVWERPGQSILARLYGGIPVHRGQYDRHLLKTMVAVLESGYSLLLAPEGGRSHVPGLRRGLPGAAYVIDKVAVPVPVVPAGIVGTTEDFIQRALHLQRPLLEMRIGQPFTLPPIGRGESATGPATRHQALQDNADLIMKHVADLLPPEYRGVYTLKTQNGE